MEPSEFEEKVKKWMAEQNLLAAGDTCIIGVSGGADSICLLTVLAHLKDELSLSLIAVHVHHGLRGAEADEDEAYVKEYCEMLSVPLDVYHIDAAALAKTHGQTVEEAGREARYRAFEETAEKRHLTQYKVAVAHNKNDDAETVLLHMVRGTGMTGMKGIPARRGHIIRPLLQMERTEIEDYLAGLNIAYRTDCTNLEDAYARNKIRLHVLNELQEVNVRAVDHITEFAKLAESYDRYAREQMRKFLYKNVMLYDDNAQTGCIHFDSGAEESGYICQNAGEHAAIGITDLQAQDELIADGALLELISWACGGRKDIGKNHVEEVKKLYLAANGSRIMLPHGAAVRREYEMLVFYGDAEKIKPDASAFAWCIDVTASGEYLLPDGGSLNIEIMDHPVHLDLTKKEYTKFADYDRIQSGITIRTYQENDVIVVTAAGGRKKINRLFSAYKIPAGERSRIPLVVSGQDVIWAVGVRLSEAYKVRPETQRVLRMEYRPKME